MRSCDYLIPIHPLLGPANLANVTTRKGPAKENVRGWGRCMAVLSLLGLDLLPDFRRNRSGLSSKHLGLQYPFHSRPLARRRPPEVSVSRRLAELGNTDVVSFRIFSAPHDARFCSAQLSMDY